LKDSAPFEIPAGERVGTRRLNNLKGAISMTRLNLEDLEGRALMSAVAPLSNPVGVESAIYMKVEGIYMKVEGVDGSVTVQRSVGGESTQQAIWLQPILISS
jgi:hypothetical protein